MLPITDPTVASGASHSRRRRRGADGAGQQQQQVGMAQDVPPPPPPPPPPLPPNPGPSAASSNGSTNKAIPGTSAAIHQPNNKYGDDSSSSSSSSSDSAADRIHRRRQRTPAMHSIRSRGPSPISEPLHRPVMAGGLAGSSVFTRASMSDLLHGSPPAQYATDGAGGGGGASESSKRALTADPYYVAPTRELLLSQYMVSDKAYQDFLLYGRGYKDDHLPGMDCGGIRVTGKGCARGCAGVSFVGMLFLLWAGFMIHLQPLYLKGFDYNAGFLKSGNTAENGGGTNNYYGRGQQQYQQQKYGQNERRPLRPAASNAFKAAAAYFVTMVFSLICVHNYDDIDFSAVVPRWRILLKVRQNCAMAYHQYRRRHYTDIPDTPTGAVSGRRRRRRGKGGGGDGGELPLFQSASTDTTRRRRGAGGSGSGSGTAAGVGVGNDEGGESLPTYNSPGGDKPAAENFTLELWNRVSSKVKGGIRSPMGRKGRRDAKTKHV